MERINFTNLPSTDIPLNATNLNLMQDNIEAEIRTKISNVLSTSYKGDMNDLITTCFIYADGTATNTPLAGYSFYVTVIALSDKYIIQKANRVSATYFEEYQRQCTNGTWTEWRKTSQPNITTGTEFKTGRIIDGKEEYGKRIDCGAMPNATSKYVNTRLSGISLTRPIDGVMKNASSTPYNLPYYSMKNGNYFVELVLNATGNTLTVTTNTDFSSNTGFATLYYTKNS